MVARSDDVDDRLEKVALGRSVRARKLTRDMLPEPMMIYALSNTQEQLDRVLNEAEWEGERKTADSQLSG